MRRLLWIGDAVVSSGFAKATHATLETLRKTWEVHVLGLNYFGDPHPYPYAIYPAYTGGDGFGVKRTAALTAALKPDLVVVQNDPWNIREYTREIARAGGDIPVVASMPVDGKNCRGDWLNSLALGVFWTQFGLDEAKDGGFVKPGVVIPLGVDLDQFRPLPRRAAREQLGLPEQALDAFIVGNVNRNQPRKRLDLTIQYFCEWVLANGIEDAYLYLHIAPTGELAMDARQFFGYCGLRGKKRLLMCEPDVGLGMDEAEMPFVYSAFDVQVSTTQGEGWGLTTMEGMACGVPQIVPVWSALGDWCTGAARIFCDGRTLTPGGINVVGATPAKAQFIAALDGMYRSEQTRRTYSDRGLELVSRPVYRWGAIGARWAEELDKIVPPQEG